MRFVFSASVLKQLKLQNILSSPTIFSLPNDLGGMSLISFWWKYRSRQCNVPHWQVSGPTPLAAFSITPAVTAGRGHWRLIK